MSNQAAPVYRLIYLSSATSPLAQHDLDDILGAARRNNPKAGVTGLLLFHDGCFFQVLEGAQSDVNRIFGAIRSDPRHSGMLILLSGETPERSFAQWSMGYVGAHRLNEGQRQWLVDLGDLIGAERPVALSSSASTALQIDSFLESFREFAAA